MSETASIARDETGFPGRSDLFSLEGRKVWVAGHSGLVGSAVSRHLETANCDVLSASHVDLDLTKQSDTYAWMAHHKPEVVIMAAAKVGGIGANADFPAEFLFDNLAIAQNIMHGAYLNKVRKLVFLGSSCIYPKFAEQPIREEALLTGALEPTNEAYAIAKIAGIRLYQFYRRQYGCDFISLMPCNIYGSNDHWNDERAHVIPSLISKMHRAKIENSSHVGIWGSGEPLREFLFVNDLAEGIGLALRNYSGELPLNIGSGQEISIRRLAMLIKKCIGFKGGLVFDTGKPDGTPRKILDSSRMRALGWTPQTDLEKGLSIAYGDFLVSAGHV